MLPASVQLRPCGGLVIDAFGLTVAVDVPLHPHDPSRLEAEATRYATGTSDIDWRDVDVIVVCSTAGLLGLPYVTEYSGFSGAVHTTTPVMEMGKIAMCALTDMRGPAAALMYSPADIESSLSRITVAEASSVCSIADNVLLSNCLSEGTAVGSVSWLLQALQGDAVPRDTSVLICQAGAPHGVPSTVGAGVDCVIAASALADPLQACNKEHITSAITTELNDERFVVVPGDWVALGGCVGALELCHALCSLDQTMMSHVAFVAQRVGDVREAAGRLVEFVTDPSYAEQLSQVRPDRPYGWSHSKRIGTRAATASLLYTGFDYKALQAPNASPQRMCYLLADPGALLGTPLVAGLLARAQNRSTFAKGVTLVLPETYPLSDEGLRLELQRQLNAGRAGAAGPPPPLPHGLLSIKRVKGFDARQGPADLQALCGTLQPRVIATNIPLSTPPHTHTVSLSGGAPVCLPLFPEGERGTTHAGSGAALRAVLPRATIDAVDKHRSKRSRDSIYWAMGPLKVRRRGPRCVLLPDPDAPEAKRTRLYGTLSSASLESAVGLIVGSKGEVEGEGAGGSPPRGVVCSRSGGGALEASVPGLRATLKTSAGGSSTDVLFEGSKEQLRSLVHVVDTALNPA